jgi:hypothetical protein
MMHQRGQVAVASKPNRGSGEAFPERGGFVRIDVTSASNAKAGSALVKSLSPLLIGPTKDCDGNDVVRFENLYQFRKVFAELKHWDEAANEPSFEWREWKFGLEKCIFFVLFFA